MSLIYNDFYDAPNPLCLAPWNCLTVHPDGRINSDMHFKAFYGSLYENTLQELWHSDVARELRSDIIKKLPSLRFSFSFFNTKDEVDYVIQSLSELQK